MGIIYKATNLINGKVYIGQTTRSLDQRIREHLNCKKNYIFSNALRKYGIQNFSFEILKKTDNLQEYEKLYIAKFDSFNNGYNMTEGGDISPMLYPDIAKRVAETKKGTESPFKGCQRPEMRGKNNPAKRPEVRNKISKSKIGKLNPNYGKKLKFSEERNKKISKKLKGRKFTEDHRRKISEHAKKRNMNRNSKGRFIKGDT